MSEWYRSAVSENHRMAAIGVPGGRPVPSCGMERTDLVRTGRMSATPRGNRSLPGPAPLALTSTVLLGAGLLVREGTRAALTVRTMKQRGRQVPALDLDLRLPGRRPVRRVAVLGDSSAAGHGLPHADEAVGRRVCRALVARDGRATDLRALAVDGADIRCVIDHQLEAARDAEVVLLGVGANDAIRRHTPVRVARELTQLFDAIREVAAPEATIVLLSAPDLSVAPALPPILRGPLGWWCRTTARVQAAIAAQHGVEVISLPREALAPEVFGHDGFHPGTIGHERTAAEIVERLADR